LPAEIVFSEEGCKKGVGQQACQFCWWFSMKRTAAKIKTNPDKVQLDRSSMDNGVMVTL